MEGAEEAEKAKGLTIARLRKLKNYEQLTDEQAMEVIQAIKSLASICFQFMNDQKKKEEEQTRKKDEEETS